MKALATRALSVVLFIAGISLAAIFFALGCEALQLGPFIPTASTSQPPAIQAGFALLLSCGAVLMGLFKRFLD